MLLLSKARRLLLLRRPPAPACSSQWRALATAPVSSASPGLSKYAAVTADDFQAFERILRSVMLIISRRALTIPRLVHSRWIHAHTSL